MQQSTIELLKKIGTVAEKLSFSVFIVGGFVRDLLLSLDNDDIDLVVEGNGGAFADALAAELGKKGEKVIHHHEFLTSVVTLANGWKVDVATARTEKYVSNAALPLVEASTLEKDLYRRDFSVNALAIRLTSSGLGEMMDFFSGEKHLKEKKIAILHPLSFYDDPTRMIRAIRFEQRYNFSIAEETELLLHEALNKKILEQLSGSRIFHELEKIFQEKKSTTIKNAIRRAAQLNIFTHISPSWKDINLEGFGAAVDSSDYFSQFTKEKAQPEEKKKQNKDGKEKEKGKKGDKPQPLSLSWKYFFMALVWWLKEEDAEKVMKRLNFNSTWISDFQQGASLIKNTIPAVESWQRGSGFNTDGDSVNEKSLTSDLYLMLKPFTVDWVVFLMSVMGHKHQKLFTSYLLNVREMKLDINGHDLKSLGIPNGPIYKQILDQVLIYKLNERVLADKGEQLKLAQQIYSEIKK